MQGVLVLSLSYSVINKVFWPVGVIANRRYSIAFIILNSSIDFVVMWAVLEFIHGCHCICWFCLQGIPQVGDDSSGISG